MTAGTNAPQYVKPSEVARLYGVTQHIVYAMVARKEIASELIAGRAVIVFASLPEDKQRAYLAAKGITT